MVTYIIRRSIQSVFVLLLITLIVFFTLRWLPGDPILLFLSEDELQLSSPERIEYLRHEFGLDRPIIVQYIDWLSDVIHGNLGTSLSLRHNVAIEITRRIPITFHIGILSFIISFIIGVTAGVITAVRRGTWMDTVVTTLANMGITVPVFWLGILMIYLFSLKFRLLPTYGYTSPLEDFWLSTKQIIMPVICLSVFSIASNARLTRASILEVMRQDYIRTAWSKGLKEITIIVRHALKNGIIPVVTISGLSLRNIIGGSVFIETVFNIPGMGRLAVDSIMSQDYPMVQGVILVIATTVLLANFIIDLSYGWLDPRVKYN